MTTGHLTPKVVSAQSESNKYKEAHAILQTTFDPTPEVAACQPARSVQLDYAEGLE